MSGKIVTVAIHKGGTGKTTVAVNLSRLAYERGLKVLLIDLDTQGNATDNFLEVVPDGCLTSSSLFEEIFKALPPLAVLEGLDIIPADATLLAVERYPFEAANFFKENVSLFKEQYDLIVIDTPPTMGFAMLAPLTASDFTLAPIFPDAYSIKGVKTLFSRIKDVKSKYNPNLTFLGLLINRWSRTNRAQNQVVDVLRNKLNKYVLPVDIGDHVHVEYAAHSRSAVWHQARSGAHRTAGNAVRNAMLWILNETVLGGANVQSCN